MKSIQSITVATWMLEHLAFGSDDEALSGDLLEELHSGRSAAWYWRQVLSAIGAGILRRSGTYALPLLFAAAWSTLYPAWRAIGRVPLTQSIYERWASLDWPFSTSLTIVNGIVPAATFIWLGFFIYLMSRREMAHGMTGLRLLGSLSIALNVLLVTTIALAYSGINVRSVPRENFLANPHLVAINIQLALGLFSAIVCALRQARRQHPGADSLAG